MLHVLVICHEHMTFQVWFHQCKVYSFVSHWTLNVQTISLVLIHCMQSGGGLDADRLMTRTERKAVKRKAARCNSHIGCHMKCMSCHMKISKISFLNNWLKRLTLENFILRIFARICQGAQGVGRSRSRKCVFIDFKCVCSEMGEEEHYFFCV